MVRPVFANHVIQHFAAPLVTKVRIDIRHADAFRIQETFKEQVVFQRIDIRDVQQVGHDAAGGTAAARADGNRVRAAAAVLMAAAVADEVPDNQEVGGIPHGPDDAQLVAEALFHLVLQGLALRRIGQGGQVGTVPVRDFGRTYVAHAGIGIAAVFFRNGEFRQEQFAEGEVHVAPFRDGVGIAQGFFVVREQFLHLLVTLAVVPVVVELHAVRIGDGLIRLDAQEYVLGAGVLAAHVMQVIGHNQLQPELRCQFVQAAVHPGLLGQIVVLHFQEQVLLVENVQVFPHSRAGPLLVPTQDGLGNFPLDTGRQADDAFVILAQDILVDAGFAVEPVDVAQRDQMGKVAVSLIVLGQQNQMVAGLLVDAVEAAARRQIDFAADDDADTGFSLLFRLLRQFLRRLIQVHGPVHVAVVRNGNAVHAQLHGTPEQLLRFGGAVKQAVLGMDV